MGITQKCQYALRALFELAKRYGEKPAKISEIAEAQGIPPRFLEVILNELKQGGFAESRRGKDGGYTLLREPRKLTVGEVIRFVQGPIGPAEKLSNGPRGESPGAPDVLRTVWKRAEEALSGVYDNTTFQDLLEEESRLRQSFAPDFTI